MSAARDSLVFRVSNQRLMRRQGIGFSVHGVVVDRKTLSRIFFLVMGTVGKERSSRAGITKGLTRRCRTGTIGPIIIALRPPAPLDLAVDECSLTDAQKAAVRAVVDSWANSSFCTYNNVTIGGIMAGA